MPEGIQNAVAEFINTQKEERRDFLLAADGKWNVSATFLANNLLDDLLDCDVLA